MEICHVISDLKKLKIKQPTIFFFSKCCVYADQHGPSPKASLFIELLLIMKCQCCTVYLIMMVVNTTESVNECCMLCPCSQGGVWHFGHSPCAEGASALQALWQYT